MISKHIKNADRLKSHLYHLTKFMTGIHQQVVEFTDAQHELLQKGEKGVEYEGTRCRLSS